MTRRLHPEYLDRLRLEAEAAETVMIDRIGARHRQISNQVPNWAPGPMPDDWVPSDMSIIEPLPKPRRLK